MCVKLELKVHVYSVGDDVSRTEECSHLRVVDVKGWTGSVEKN